MPPSRKLKATSSVIVNGQPVSPIANVPPIPPPAPRGSRRRQDTDDAATSQSSNGAQESSWTEPPFCGFIETTEDALLILEAARRRMIPRVTRRLADRERKLINSGSVFVFEEEESGIKRWTDGCLWSPSRILGNFLLYRETDKRATDPSATGRKGSTTASILVTEASDPDPNGLTDHQKGSRGMGSLSRPKNQPNGAGPLTTADSPGAVNGGVVLDRARERVLLGSLTNSYKFKDDGMMKKTFSITLPNSNKTHHLVSYYKVSDVEAGRLRTPSSLPELMALDISPEFLEKTHFRVPPRVEVGEDGRVRYRGESRDELDSPTMENAQLPSGNGLSKPRAPFDNPVPFHGQYDMGSDVDPAYPRGTSEGFLTQPYSPSSASSMSWSASTTNNTWQGNGGGGYSQPQSNGHFQASLPTPNYPVASTTSNGYPNGYNYAAASPSATQPLASAYSSPTAYSSQSSVPNGYTPTLVQSNNYGYQSGAPHGYNPQTPSPAYIPPPAVPSSFPFTSAFSQSQYEIPPPSRSGTSISSAMERSSTVDSMSGEDSSFYSSSVEPSLSAGSSSASASTTHSSSPDEFESPPLSAADQPRMDSVSSPMLDYDQMSLSRRSSILVSSPIQEPQGLRKGSGIVSNIPMKQENDFDDARFAGYRSRGDSQSSYRSGHRSSASVGMMSPVVSGTHAWPSQEPIERNDMYPVYTNGYTGQPPQAYPNGYANGQSNGHSSHSSRYHQRTSSTTYAPNSYFPQESSIATNGMYATSQPPDSQYPPYNMSSSMAQHPSMRSQISSPDQYVPPSTASSTASHGYISSGASNNSNGYAHSQPIQIRGYSNSSASLAQSQMMMAGGMSDMRVSGTTAMM